MKDPAAPPTRNNIKEYILSFTGYGKIGRFGRGDDDGFIQAIGGTVTVTGDLQPGNDIQIAFERSGRLPRQTPKKNPQPHHLFLNEVVTLRAAYEPPPPVEIGVNEIHFDGKTRKLVEGMVGFRDDELIVVLPTTPTTKAIRDYLYGLHIGEGAAQIQDFESPYVVIYFDGLDKTTPLGDDNRPDSVQVYLRNFGKIPLAKQYFTEDIAIEKFAGQASSGGEVQLSLTVHDDPKHPDTSMNIALHLDRTFQVAEMSTEGKDPKADTPAKDPLPPATVPQAKDLSKLSLEALVGRYERKPVENEAHRDARVAPD